MRAALFALMIAAAGCYSPGLQPCQIACSANRECPDGLACNGQNACAMSSTAMCNELPIDAPGDGPASSVTIEVRDSKGGPLAAALVVFADPAGAQIAETPTGADGKATADVPAGGSATVIRMVPRPNGQPGADLHATTYLDLWPGARIISQAQLEPSTRKVSIELMPPAGTSMFTVHTSCAGFSSSTLVSIVVEVPVRCSMFDVFVIASSATFSSESFAAVLPAQTGDSIVVPASSFKPTRSLTGTLTGLPGNASNRFLNVAAWVTPTLPSSNSALASANPTPVGDIGPVVVPMDVGLQTLLFVGYQPDPASPMSQQIVVDRMPASATAINRDYNSTLLPWVGDPKFDIGSRRMSWPIYLPSVTTPVLPTLFATTVTYQRDPSLSVTWRVVGDAARIMTTGTEQSFTYPDVPGMRNFEPLGADVVSSPEDILLFGVEAAAARDLRQILEPEGIDLGYFKIPTLRHLTISRIVNTP